MKNTIAFAGSNSSSSINEQLISYISNLKEGIETLKLTEYDAPIYSEDIEKQSGIPQSIISLNNQISKAEIIIISVSEHNGNLSAFFKNIIDWLSRLDYNFLTGKEVILFSCSPGEGGAIRALNVAEKTLPFFGASIKSTLSIANFNAIFENGIINNSAITKQIIKSLS